MKMNEFITVMFKELSKKNTNCNQSTQKYQRVEMNEMREGFKEQVREST